jgi:ankyrin repeat protein
MIDYASLHWPAHLRQSNFMESADEETIGLLKWFIHSDDYPGNYVSWQQMYHRDVTWYCGNRPAYFYAIEFNIDSLVKLVLPLDMDIDQMPDGNWPQTPLHVAARCGALSIVQDLVRRGASMEFKSGPAARSMTALHFAAEGGHAEVIKFLLKSGASPHSRSESQSTPFYRAARSGSLKALRVLYDAGSDINALTWDNFTPLFEAVAHGRIRTAGQLLEWGADPTIMNGMGESTLKLLKRARNFRAAQRRYPLVTENDVLNDIQTTQAADGGFAYYLKDLAPQYELAMSIELDSRPGIEREKDYRWSRDVSDTFPF